MCGLFAVVAKTNMGLFDKDFKDYVHPLFMMTNLRGLDGSGVYYTDYKEPNTRSSTIKIGADSLTLMRTNEYRNWYDKAKSRAGSVVGHCRSATVGDVSTENAHPFISGMTTLVHNGTLRDAPEHYKIDTKVDSQWLCNGLAEDGFDALAKIKGAIAAIWHDAEKGMLHFYRNYERPMFVAQSKDRILAASELGFLYTTIDRLNTAKLEDFDISELSTEEVYTWNLTNLCWLPAKRIYPTYEKVKTYSMYGSPKSYPVVESKATKVTESGDIYFELDRIDESFVEKNMVRWLGTEIAAPPDVRMIQVHLNKNDEINVRGIYKGTYNKKIVRKVRGEDVTFYNIKKESIEELSTTEADKLIDELPDDNTFVTTVNNCTMSVDEFKEIAISKCSICTGEIDVENADKCSLVQETNKLMCPDCTQTHVGLINTIQ